MDFSRRLNERPGTAKTSDVQSTASVASSVSTAKKTSGDVLLPGWVRIASVVLLFSVAILIVGVASLSYVNRAPQYGLVNTKDEQAVFLNNGQVYFGKIKGINSSFFNLENIFYLNSSSSSGSSSSSSSASSNELTLVKLGCEIHAPVDQMVINTQQVSFWENLSPSGKVSKAITQWNTENPNGLTCTNTSSTTQQSNNNSTSTTQNTTNSSTSK